MLAAAWKFRVPLAALAAALALLGLFYYVDDRAYRRGYDTRVAEEAAEAQRRIKDATDADERARACAADPDCRLRSDPWERR